MTLTIFDPRTGTRVTVKVPTTSRSEQRARRWVLRRLDRLNEERHAAGAAQSR
ncbi:MAG TPA: hypothetical protein VHG30_07130 [Microvirga sp.]|jgi:hypothetical protein|nr:hypothetical protein [Microvirga sp.]